MRTPAPQKTVKVPATLPAGPDLAIPYYEGRTYYCPGFGDVGTHLPVPKTAVTTYIYPGRGAGSPIPVQLAPKEKVIGFTQLGNRYLLAVTDCTSSEIRSYAADGTYKALGTFFSEHPFTSGAGMVAVSTGRRQVTLFKASTGKKLRTWNWSARFANPSPDQVLPDGSVIVYGFIGGGEKTRILRTDGTITKLPSLLVHADGVNPVNGSVLSWVRTASCARNIAAFDPQTQDALWADCGYTTFSYRGESIGPDGKLVAAAAAKDKVSFLDAETGAVPLQFLHGPRPCGGGCGATVVWEDATHLVMQNSYQAPFALFRFGLNGKVNSVSIAQPPTDTGKFSWVLFMRQ